MISSLDSSESSSLLGGLIGSSGVDNISSSEVTTEEALAILKSRKFLENHARENDLLKIIFSHSWDKENEKWSTGLEEPPTMSDGYEFLNDSVQVSFNKSLITLEITFHEKENISYLLNGLIEGVNSYIRDKSITESQNNISYLQKEIDKTKLNASIDMLYRLIERQTQSVMLANTRQDYAFKVIDPAIIPIHPAGPNRKLIVIIGSILGFIIAFFLGFIQNFISISRSS
jgi:hypothetical protein